MGVDVAPCEGGTASSIHSFPPELLLQIFRELHSMESERRSTLLGHSMKGIDPMIFPDSISNVCTYWDAVLGLEPEFWQEKLIVIGLVYPRPASRLQRYLELSFAEDKSLQVSVWGATVDDRSQAMTVSRLCQSGWEHLERTRLQAIVPLLAGNMHRIRSLRIHTTFVDSLPTISELITQGGASGLCEIAVSGTVDNNTQASGKRNSLSQPLPHPPLLPSFTDLHYLHLSGRPFISFARIVLHSDGSRQHDNFPPHLRLDISHVRSFSGDPIPFHLEELIQFLYCCGKAQSLTLSNINLLPYKEFPSQPPTQRSHLPSLPTHRLGFTTVMLINTSSPSTEAVLLHTLRRCPTPRDHGCTLAGLQNCTLDNSAELPVRLMTSRLKLQDIGDSQSMDKLLACIECPAVLVESSAGLDDGFFNKAIQPRSSDGHLIMRFLQVFTINACPNVTFDAVQRFMEFRSNPQFHPDRFPFRGRGELSTVNLELWRNPDCHPAVGIGESVKAILVGQIEAQKWSGGRRTGRGRYHDWYSATLPQCTSSSRNSVIFRSL